MIELKSDQEILYALPESPEASKFGLTASFLINYSEEFEKSHPNHIKYRVDSDGSGLDLALQRERTALFEHMERWISAYLDKRCPICRFTSPTRCFFKSEPNEAAKKYMLTHPEEANLAADGNMIHFQFDYFREMDRTASLMSSYFVDIDNAYKQANPPARSYKNSRGGTLASGFAALLFAVLVFVCLRLREHTGKLLEILPTVGAFMFGLLALFFLLIFFSGCSGHRGKSRKVSNQAELDAAYYKAVEENVPKIHRYIRFCRLWCEAAHRPYPKKLETLQRQLDTVVKNYNNRKALRG